MKYRNTYTWLAVILVIALVIPAEIGCGKKAAQETTPIPTVMPTATRTVPTEPTGETGTLSGLQGDVQVLRTGTSAWEAATSGMQIGTGYGVKTGSNGYVLITLFDGSMMELEANTEISVEELSEASGGATTVRINQVLGNTINRVENLVDSSSTYEIETLAGSAVVRGTWYSVMAGMLGSIPRTCCGTLDQGDGQEHFVAFSNSGKTVDVPVNRMSCATGDSVPSDPFPSSEAVDPLRSVTLGGGGGGGYQPTPTCAFRYDSGPYTPTSEWQTISGSSDIWNHFLYYLFYLEAGHNYRFTMCEGGGHTDYGDPIFILSNCAGGTITYNYNYCGYSPQMDYTPTETGPYILQVGPWDGYSYSFTVAYRINEP